MKKEWGLGQTAVRTLPGLHGQTGWWAISGKSLSCGARSVSRPSRLRGIWPTLKLAVVAMGVAVLPGGAVGVLLGVAPGVVAGLRVHGRCGFRGEACPSSGWVCC